VSEASAWARAWHGDVPAVRLAAFRTFLALYVLTLYRGLLTRDLRALARWEFHSPFVDGLPIPPAWMHPGIEGLIVLAALGLFFGVAARAAAFGLAAIGFWIVLLDQDFFKHNLWLCINLLFLLGFAPGRIRLWDLFTGRARAVRAAAWPERLVRMQIAIAFGFATVHKIVGRDWGLEGARMAQLVNAKSHLIALAPLDSANDFALSAAPGAISAFVIVLEAAIFVYLLRPKPWWLAATLVAGFAAYIEVLLRPLLFSWMVGTSILLIVPVGGATCRIVTASDCARCTRRRRWTSALDWFGRVTFEPGTDCQPERCSGWVVHDGAETLRGLRAMARVAFTSVVPVFGFVILAGAAGLRWRASHVSGLDLLVLAMAGVAALAAVEIWGRLRARRAKPA